MIRTKITVVLFILLLNCFQSFAQSEGDSLPLISVLNELQKRFGCSFSYVDNDLENITVEAPNKNLDLKAAVTYLQKQTLLNFTYLDPTTITISARLFTICGVLISASENTVITNATIQSQNKTTVTDQNGTFSIELADLNQLIKIQFLGYTALQLPARDLIEQPCKEIMMTREVQYLNEIILNDYLIKGIGKKNDGSIRIDYDDFGILPGLIEPDLLQTIQALPGILSTEETVSDINVRGGTNDQNLILWDGIKMYQSGHFFGLISAFNPYLTKNVELLKNGTGARYGDGVSSVIAMSTDNEVAQQNNTSFGVNMTSIDGYTDLRLGKKSSIQLSVRKSISEVLETPTYRQFFDKSFQDSEVVENTNEISNTNDEFSFYDTSLRWLYQFSPKDLIKINALLIRNDLMFQENAIVNSTNEARASSLKQNNTAGGLSYQRNWNDSFNTEIIFYGTNYNLEAINSDIINNQRLLQENEVLESGVKINGSFKIHPNLHWFSGYQFNETGISNLRDVNNPTFRDFTKEVIRTNSLYSEINYNSPNNSTHVTAGARLNHYGKLDRTLLEPRLSVTHKFLDHFTVEVLGELKSQVTSQVIESQNNFLGVENRNWVLSNEEDIPIIESEQVSLGITYTHNNWLINVDTFYKNVSGILSKSQGFQNQFEFVPDHGSYTTRGVDFLINKRFKNLSTWLSYSYAKNDYTFNRLFPRDFPNNIDIRHNINFAVAYSVNNLKLSTGINWHSGRPTTRPALENQILANGNINYQAPNSDTLQDYFRWDASATYVFNLTKGIKGTAGLSLWNLTSRENVVNNYYRVNDNGNVEEVQQLGLGFTPNAVLRINF